MKKNVFFKFTALFTAVLFVLPTGCKKIDRSDSETQSGFESVKNDFNSEKITIAVNPEQTETETDRKEYVDGLDIPINLYLDLNGDDHYSLCSSHTSIWTQKKDIACFAAIISDESELSGGLYKNIWKAQRDKYDKNELFRIGYILKYSLKNGEENIVTILSPKDAEGEFNTYLEVYLYDDIHQIDGQWYSHILEADMTDESVLTSFKLTAGENINMVKEISLSVFLYSGEEYFDGKEYVGTHITKIPIICA